MTMKTRNAKSESKQHTILQPYLHKEIIGLKFVK